MNRCLRNSELILRVGLGNSLCNIVNRCLRNSELILPHHSYTMHSINGMLFRTEMILGFYLDTQAVDSKSKIMVVRSWLASEPGTPSTANVERIRIRVSMVHSITKLSSN